MAIRRKADAHDLSERLKFLMVGYDGETTKLRKELTDLAPHRGMTYWMHKRADLRNLALKLERMQAVADELVDVFEEGQRAATSEVCCGGEVVEQWHRCGVCGEVNRPVSSPLNDDIP